MPRSLALDRKVETMVARLRRGSPPAATRAQVLEAVGRRGLDAARRDGRIVAVLPGVYIATDRSGDHAVRCAAVVLWSGGRVLVAGESALHLLDDRYPAPARVRAIAPAAWNARAPEWLHLTRTELPRVTAWGQGSPCQTSEDAVLDAWSCASRARRTAIVYEALWLRVVGPRRLIGAAARRPRLPDRRRFDTLMADFVTGATSPTEVMARREVFTGPRFAALEWQVPMVIEGGRRVIDVLHRAARLAIELDGAAYHSGAAADRDRERDTQLTAAGWHPIHFRYRDLRDRPDWCRRMLLRAIEAYVGTSSTPR